MTHTHTHTHTHAYIHTFIHTYPHAYTHTHTHAHMHTYTHTRMLTHPHMHTYIHMITHIHIYTPTHTHSAKTVIAGCTPYHLAHDLLPDLHDDAIVGTTAEDAPAGGGGGELNSVHENEWKSFREHLLSADYSCGSFKINLAVSLALCHTVHIILYVWCLYVFKCLYNTSVLCISFYVCVFATLTHRKYIFPLYIFSKNFKYLCLLDSRYKSLNFPQFK